MRQGRHAASRCWRRCGGTTDQPVRGHRLARLVEPVPGRPARRAVPGAVPALRRSSPSPLWQLGDAPVRGARRRPARGAARPRRDPAGRARPGNRRADRPRPAVPGLRLRGVRGRADRSRASRAARRCRCRSIRVDAGDRCGREVLLPGEPSATRPMPAYLPVPRAVQLDGPLRARRARAGVPAGQPRMRRRRTGELPPYVVWVHGGPTVPRRCRCSTWRRPTSPAAASASSTSTTAGSTGYGRAYRERLRGQWGVVDVDDAMAAALALAEAGEADPATGWRSAAARRAAGPRWPR